MNMQLSSFLFCFGVIKMGPENPPTRLTGSHKSIYYFRSSSEGSILTINGRGMISKAVPSLIQGGIGGPALSAFFASKRAVESKWS